MSTEIVRDALCDARVYLDAMLAGEAKLMQIQEAGNFLADTLRGGMRFSLSGRKPQPQR